MAWNDLKAAVAAVIKTNGTQAITGALLQSTLNSIIDQVGANSTFKGVATPSTNPGTPDGPVFYLAGTKGVYSNFDGYVHNGEQLVVLTNISGSWAAIQTGGVGIQSKVVIDSAIEVLIRSANPNFIFSGYIDTTTPIPAFAKNKAYIAIEDGTIFGITGVKKGQIVYDTGSTFKKTYIPSQSNLPRSINIYDKTKPLLPGYWSTSGSWIASTDHQNTDLIDVSEFEYIFIQCSQITARVLVFFDKNGALIKPLESTTSNYLVPNWGLHKVPDGAVNVSILVKYSGVDARSDLMIEKGYPGQTTGSNYSPYGFNDSVSTDYVDTEIAKTVKKDDLFILNDLSEKHKDTIVDNYYVANNTGVITALATVSYVVIPVVENTWIFFLVETTPYINVSHAGVYKGPTNNFIANFSGISNTTGLQMFKVPAGATHLYINFQTIYFDRFKVLDVPGYINMRIDQNLIQSKNINSILNYNQFQNTAVNKILGYFLPDGTITSMAGVLGMTIPYGCKMGDVFRVSNFSSTTYPPSSLSFKVVELDENLQFIQRVNKLTDPYDYTVPSGVGYVMFLMVLESNSNLRVEKISSPNSEIKVIRSSIFPPIPEGVGEILWNGIRWTSLGDSLTFRETWQPYLVTKYGLIHTNCGISSTRLAGADSNAFWQDVRLNAVKASNPSLLTILGGANDLTQDIPIGTDSEFDLPLGSKDKLNFKGAYSYIIENLLTWKPSLKIIILTTSFAHSGGASYSPSGTMRYYMYANASREVAQHYGLPVVDLYRDMNLNKLTQSIYTTDNIHWNETGSKVVASLVADVLNKINSI